MRRQQGWPSHEPPSPSQSTLSLTHFFSLSFLSWCLVCSTRSFTSLGRASNSSSERAKRASSAAFSLSSAQRAASSSSATGGGAGGGPGGVRVEVENVAGYPQPRQQFSPTVQQTKGAQMPLGSRSWGWHSHTNLSFSPPPSPLPPTVPGVPRR